MKFYSTSNVFQFSWNKVSTAFWERYPNPQSSHVVSEDTVARALVDGKLISHRVLTKTSSLPKWSKTFMPAGSSKVCILEESIVDVESQTLTTYTRNVGLTKFMTIDEKCTYKPCPDNKEWTLCERQAWISSSLYGLSSAIQSFGVERFRKNIPKTVKGFEYVLNKLFILPDVTTDCSMDHATSRIKLNSEKLKESKEKLKESALKAKESARELAKSKTKSAPKTESVAA